ncbi:response regulator transcription factor [Rathayibacter soli]|uniref:response regulator transcription factor n=1 Tax=Rathayibacter soli TaxID=3144168 RepID=UPI0027E4D733|nr:response regulator transcription factor [Glaciibacter superstes]
MRVIIGEDEVLLRQGLELLLERGGFDVVAAAPDADQLMEAVEAHHPDLVVTDIQMPPNRTDDGMVAALRIRSQHPEIAVVVLSQYVQRRYVAELLADGSAKVGYQLKQRISDVETFLGDLRKVTAGGTAIDPDVIAVMMNRAKLGNGDVARLTPRQQEVLALVAEGRSNASIAAQLVVTERAVVQHISRIYSALGMPADASDHRRVLAVLRYLAQ